MIVKRGVEGVEDGRMIDVMCNGTNSHVCGLLLKSDAY